MVAGMCATVLLTTGRTVGAEQAVLTSIDSAGTRSIVVRAEDGSGLDSTVLDRLANVDGIEWIGAFGAATDTQNAAFPGGQKVAVRDLWVENSTWLSFPTGAEPGVYGSDAALDTLGAPDATGAVRAVDGTTYSILGRATPPDFLNFLEPFAVVPRDRAASGPVSVLVVVAQRPDLVTPLSQTVQSVLAVPDPTKVQVSTSENLATLRALVQGQLGSYGRSLVLVVFGVTAVLVAAILYGLVMLRRKDFGRRRALGASRGLIISLLLFQTAIVSAVGALLGNVTAALGLVVSGDPLPAWDFFAAVSLLAIVVSVAAAALPAIAAARRDPLTELRVP
ncbi:lipoprotein ABC transporter permease (plasmid) [Humibacter sp. BT305]|nr:lipoprotein ABC transporter permease [Humibacter sp. BT305]